MKLKGAEGRRMLRAVCWCFEHMHVPANEHQRIRYTALKSLENLYKEMKDDVWEASVSIPKAQALAREHLACYQELNRTAVDSRMWVIYPKHHLFHHWIVELVRWGHPRDCWTYLDESATGELAAVAPSLHASTLSRTLMQKVRL
jgi:hypothetical protein